MTNTNANTNEVEMVQFMLNLSRGLRHRTKLKSVMLSEERGTYVTMTDVITEALEAHLKGVEEP
jgi:hypothetical protein